MKEIVNQAYEQQTKTILRVSNEPGGKARAGYVDYKPKCVLQRQLKNAIEDSSGNGNLPLQRKANATGLPDQLKSGIENLSGYAMDDVNVHYNSAKPAQLDALAYAQGTDIHLGPGQEKHLPHEAWHVVQQKQGRVKPTMQFQGKIAVNDDAGLEREADVMGAKALSYGGSPAAERFNAVSFSGRSVHQLRIKNGNGPFAYVRSKERVKELVSERRDDVETPWINELLEEVWKRYGGVWNYTTINRIIGMIEETEENAEKAFFVFKSGIILNDKNKRLELMQEYENNKDNDELQFLDEIYQDISTRFINMLDQLLFSFYFNKVDKSIIDKAGAIDSLRKRLDLQKNRETNVPETGENQQDEVLYEDSAAFDTNTETVGNVIDTDIVTGNYAYVFGWLEHNTMIPRPTRFAASEIRNLAMSGGMRYSRPLRWILNQPGSLMMANEYVQGRDNSSEVPGFIVGVHESDEETKLKEFETIGEREQPGDRAEAMMLDLAQHIKMKLFRDFIHDAQNNDEDPTERMVTQYDAIKQIQNDAQYINLLQRIYSVKVQILFPWSLSHKIGPERQPAYLEDFHDFRNRMDRKGRIKNTLPEGMVAPLDSNDFKIQKKKTPNKVS
ncbi:MAG: DUF4157 domain-containing protein [Bacteroidota bacterium]